MPTMIRRLYLMLFGSALALIVINCMNPKIEDDSLTARIARGYTEATVAADSIRDLNEQGLISNEVRAQAKGYLANVVESLDKATQFNSLKDEANGELWLAFANDMLTKVRVLIPNERTLDNSAGNHDSAQVGSGAQYKAFSVAGSI